MILRHLDIDRIFKTAKRKGYLRCDLYGETGHHTVARFQGKIEDVRLFQVSGVALRLFDGRKVRSLICPSPTTSQLLRLLGEEEPEKEAVLPQNASEIPVAHPEKFACLSSIARALAAEPTRSSMPQIQYEDKIKYFEVADSTGTMASGREEYAGLVVQWIYELSGKRALGRAERHSGKIASLFDELKESNPFLEPIKNTLSSKPLWPAPAGQIPLHWSPRAFSKLCLQFLRAFEGDRFLESASFLTDLPTPLPLHFSVEDIPEAQGVDHEGSPRRPVMLFHEGKPKGLACNRWIAEQLSVTSTGHCRRESFQTHPTVGFWNPQIHGHFRDTAPLRKMRWGLSIQDLDILKFNPATADVSLRFTQSRLVHQGEEGESVEPIIFQGNLLRLLQSSRLFSEGKSTIGFPIFKQGQQFLTEVSSPSALSDPLPISGQVPPSHYW